MFRVSSWASVRARSLLLASVSVVVLPFAAFAQTRQDPLPSVTVDAPQTKRAAAARSPQRSGARAARPARAPTAAPQIASNQGSRAALGVLSVQQALTEINQTPGGVALVPAEAYRNSTVANTIKDILDYVPGVFAQPKWGDDTRLSIRGSGLSRNERATDVFPGRSSSRLHAPRQANAEAISEEL